MKFFLLFTFTLIILLNDFGYAKNKKGEGKSLDWFQWRGPNRDGISYEKGILTRWPEKGPDILWRINIGGGFSGVTVADGKLFSMWQEENSQFLVCLNAQTGKEFWRQKVGVKFQSGWGNGPRSTPLVDNNTVYAISAEGLLFAANISDGKIRWTHNLEKEYGSQIPSYGYSSSPLIDGEKLLVEVGGKKGYAFVALNKDTGDLIWHSQTGPAAYSSPIAVTIKKTRQIVYLGAEGLFSVSPENGRLIWQYSWNARCPASGIPVNLVTPVFIKPNKIFISGGFGTVKGAALIVLKNEKGGFVAEDVWKNNGMNNLVSTSVLLENFIYGFDDKFLKCIDAESGSEKWKKRGFKTGSLIAVDGHLIVLGENGKLALIEATPKEYKELANLKILDERCWTSPSLANGKLYLRNHEEMVCLDVAVK